MKKIILHALCIFSLVTGIPAQAMAQSIKSYMPRIDYQTAMKRFNVAKQRFESALKSNKTVLITTAALALLAAVTLIMRLRSQKTPASGDVAGNPTSYSERELLEELGKEESDDDFLFDNILGDGVGNGITLTETLIRKINESKFAEDEENRAALYDYFEKAKFPSRDARELALTLFAPPQR